MDKIKIKVKEGVLLHPNHWSTGTARILQAVAAQWPILELVITRGCEDTPGSKPNSKHLIGEAFDFRCRTLPADVDRKDLIERVMAVLGREYYGYYRNNEQTAWIHVQWNGGGRP